MLLWRVVRKKMSLIRNFAQSPWPVSSPPARFYPPFFSFVGGGPAVFLMPFCTGFGGLSRIRPPAGRCLLRFIALWRVAAGAFGAAFCGAAAPCRTLCRPLAPAAVLRWHGVRARRDSPVRRAGKATGRPQHKKLDNGTPRRGPAGRHPRHSLCFGRRCTLGATAQRLPKKNAQPFWPGTRQHPRCGR